MIESVFIGSLIKAGVLTLAPDPLTIALAATLLGQGQQIQSKGDKQRGGDGEARMWLLVAWCLHPLEVSFLDS